MSGVLILFYFFGSVALLSALAILFIRNVFHAALLLLICLLAVAALFVLMHAEFVGVTQILVYAGGVLTLIIFGIMLTSKIDGKAMMVKNNKWLAGMLAGLPMLFILITLLKQHSFQSSGKFMTGDAAIKQVGVTIMSDYVLAFEIAGLLLLVALIGAVVTATTSKKNDA